MKVTFVDPVSRDLNAASIFYARNRYEEELLCESAATVWYNSDAEEVGTVDENGRLLE